MESFLPSEIARLVLGYLEDQKCEEAYNTFLKSSIHLEECLKMKEDGRKFRTQVLGLSLLDILYEYSAIYSLVQERLKKVDPEAVERLRHSGTLLDKITFLLNSTSSGQTMLFSISLPPGNSPQTSTVAHAHVRKRLRTSSSNDKRKDISRKNFRTNDNNENSIEASGNVQNLETTNLSSLPGNLNQNISSVGQDNDIRTPKRKMQSINNNKRQSRANSVVPEELDENFDITALTQALLDNHELHEKIAENINKVICTPENTNVSAGQEMCSAQNPTPETNTSVPNTNNFTMELDNVIKKIVHDTESDPIFENFLHEVVGPPGQEETTSDDYDDRGISNTSTPSKSVSETVKKQIFKNRNRSAKLKRANSSENIVNIIDDHNAVAIESIISINAPESEITCAVPTTEVINNVDNVTVPTIISTTTNTATTVVVSESIVNINPSVPLPIPIAAPNQNLTVDTGVPTNITNIEQNMLDSQNKNVLMLGQQPIQQQQPSTYVIADSFPSLYQSPTIMPDNRIIFLSNKTSTIGSQYLTIPPTFQISQSAAVITDKDILNMPTVFISDDPKTSSGYIISQPTCAKRPKTIRKPCKKPKSRMSPRKIIQKTDSFTKNDSELSTTTTQETETVKYTISIQAEPKQITDTNEESVPSTSGITSSSKKDAVAGKNITPEKAKSTSSSKLQLSLSSPRSNKSHIRALDFSTPPKENLLPHGASTSPKSQQKAKQNKITKPTKNIKKLSTALFVSPVKSTKLPIATKSPKVKLKGDWNEDLLITNRKTDNDKNKKSPILRRSGGSEKDLNVDKSLESSEDSYKFCECKTKPVAGKKLTSWDHELRSLIVPVPSTSQPKKTPVKKRTRISQRNKDKKDKKSNANCTETEVLSIETELARMEGSIPEKQPIKEIIKEDKENEESKVTKSQVDKRKKQNSKSKTIIQKVELNIREETLSTPEKIKETEKAEDSSANTSNQDLNKSIPAESLRNMTPKIRKKCNTSSSSKKTPNNSDENKQKPAENETIEKKEMSILSPSKMDKNASEKTFVEPSVKNDSLTENDFLAPPKEVNKSVSNIITPNMLKASCSNEVTAKRNLMPVLETPMKEDSLLLPITPRLFTPFNLDSPLTRILGEKMDTGDLAPFLSPSFPMTPSFPITPHLQSGDTQSSYASRPTDYSNSSSYYQPSDSEQNQKLEQVLIDEAMKIETSDLKSKHLKTSTPCKTSDLESSAADTISETGVTAKVQLSGSLLEQSKSLSSLDSSTTSSPNTSSSLSSNDDTKENINEDEANVTVIHAVSDKEIIKTQNKEQIINKTPIKELCVRLVKTPILKKPDSSAVNNNISDNKKTSKELIKRPRGRSKSPLKRKNEKGNKVTTSTVTKRPPGRPRKINSKQQEEEDIIEKHRELKSKVTGSHVMLLKELEEKRKRIITGLKTNKIGRPKKKLTNEAIINNTKRNLRVTRANVNKMKSNEKQETNKIVPTKLKDKVSETPFIPRKSKTPQKASIESVAAKLLKEKKSDTKNEIVTPNLEINQSFSSPIYSTGSPNVSISTIGQDDGLISYTPDEEIPRLHISSDEENFENTINQNKIDDSDLLVKQLKERGIYLIPNKEKRTEQLVKEKQNEKTSIVQNEETNIVQKENEESTEQLKSIKEKTDKIEIMSDIHLDKSKVIDVSKIELSQSIITDVISRTSSKSTETGQENIVINETIETNIVTNKDKSKENVNNSDSTLDLSESCDYDFHVKVINEDSPEYINITYNETSKTKKGISDYNFTVLERNISAKIYIEELDSWEDKTFTVTPYINIYTISPKRKTKVPTADNNTTKVIKTIDTNKTKKLTKPSEIIAKTVDSNKSEPKAKTSLKPLEILYNECIDESSTDTIITIKEPEPKMKLIKSSNSNIENDKKEKQVTKDVTSNKSNIKKTISLEQYKMNKNKDNKTVQKTKDEIDLEYVEVVETSIEDEDLMIFALTNKDSNNQELNTKKRKAAEESMKQNVEKRMKPNDKHALLKSIDVDSFLTKVHGPSEKS